MNIELIELTNLKENLFHGFVLIFSIMISFPPSVLAKFIFRKLNKRGPKNEY